MSFRCGTIAIVGRPNVGKSSLLNRMVGHKISITSSKPQTTRHSIRGIVTTEHAQLIFVDTPGFQVRHGGALNAALNRSVRTALADVDLVMPVVVAGKLDASDEKVLRLIPPDRPMVVAVNKLDLAADPARMLPFLAKLQAVLPDAALVPVSARSGRNLDTLQRALAERLPEQPAIYGADELTDRDERFLAAEIVREKLFRSLGEEVPYGSVVVIESYKEEGALRRIQATIVVDREGHKGIVVGRQGERLKAIASSARLDMERLFGGKVHLDVWVKVKAGWSDSAASLRRYGFDP